jgi:hypothetical protein
MTFKLSKLFHLPLDNIRNTIVLKKYSSQIHSDPDIRNRQFFNFAFMPAK